MKVKGCDSVGSTHAMLGKLGSQLIADELLDEAIARRLAILYMTVSSKRDYLS